MQTFRPCQHEKCSNSFLKVIFVITECHDTKKNVRGAEIKISCKNGPPYCIYPSSSGLQVVHVWRYLMYIWGRFRRFASLFQMTGTMPCNNHCTQTLFPRVSKMDFCPPRIQMGRLCNAKRVTNRWVCEEHRVSEMKPIVYDAPQIRTEHFPSQPGFSTFKAFNTV